MPRGEAVEKRLEKLQSRQVWSEIEREFFQTGDSSRTLSALAEAVDGIVQEAYQDTVGNLAGKASAVLAIGRFARRELFPYSDVEVLILLESDSPEPLLKEALAEFVRQLWNAGLRPNHAVRGVREWPEMREPDADVAIGLLDRRFLAGDRELSAAFEAKFPTFLAKHKDKLSQHICQLVQGRHAKYQNTVHHLAPDVNQAPGGLRDFSAIGSFSKLCPEHVQVGNELKSAAAFLRTVRCFLDYRDQSDRGILDLDAQESIVTQPFATVKTTSGWMREYFRNARMVLNELRRAVETVEKNDSSLLVNFRDWRSRLSNFEFTVSRERVFLRNPSQLEHDPVVIFRLAEFIARHGVPPAVETEGRLEGARPHLADYCAQPRFQAAPLRRALSLPSASLTLRTLDNTGLLSAIFPEWAAISDLIVTDPEHDYTADEHTLRSIEALDGLRSAEDPARTRFSQLLSEIGDAGLLVMGLLFHNLGRGAAGEGSFQTGAAAARDAMARIQVTEEDQSTVEFLIVHQRDLSEVMSARDVDDPVTARLLAERAGTIERLKLLTVLTYASVSAASPGSMTPWRLEQLWRVYDATQHELTRELETERISAVPEDLRQHEGFIKGFPVRYLRAHSASEIESHVRLHALSRPTGVAMNLERVEGAYRLTIVARDRPGMFASFAGAISSFGLDILKAEAFSNAKGLILDTFVFADPKRTFELNPPEVERFEDLIQRVALGKTDAQRLLRSAVRPESKKRLPPPQVQFDSTACETATLVEIIAEDRPGLLYRLATVFSSAACNIDVVLIDTQGHRAIDVFYVAQDGHKLTPELQEILKQKLLAVC